MLDSLVPSRGSDDDGFDAFDEFVPGRLPDPGAFHELTAELFEERGVYDVTFGYNLARLNLDRRHPDAGLRYAEERGVTDPDGEAGGDDGRADERDDREDGRDECAVLRAEFTPTTSFCPQSLTLTKGAFRAWNGLSDRHEYDLVRVRLNESHHESGSINDTLRTLEGNYPSGRMGSDAANGDDGRLRSKIGTPGSISHAKLLPIQTGIGPSAVPVISCR